MLRPGQVWYSFSTAHNSRAPRGLGRRSRGHPISRHSRYCAKGPGRTGNILPIDLRSSIVSNLVEAKGRETIELYELIRLANWWAEEDQHQHTLMIAAAIEALHTLEPLPWAEMDRNAINAYLGPPEYTNVAEERSTFSGSGVCVIHLIGQLPEGKADSFAAFSFSPRLTSGARLGLGVRSHGCRFPKMSGVFNFFNSSLFYLISQLIRHPSREFLFLFGKSL